MRSTLIPMIKSTDRYNLHTHSFYCRHGHGTIKEYCDEAERLSLELFGFSEHMPLPDGSFGRTRMHNDEIPLYLEDIEREGKSRSMTVLRGFECDYIPRFRDYFRYYLEEEKVDYLVNGVHFVQHGDRCVSPFEDRMSVDDVYRYRDQLIEALDTGLFAFQAHPDLIFASYRSWDKVAEAVSRDIIQFAIDHRIPLEVNGNGMIKPKIGDEYQYPRRVFWSLASEMGAYCIRNSDCHEIENLAKSRGMQEEFVDQCRLKRAYPLVRSGRLGFQF